MSAMPAPSGQPVAPSLRALAAPGHRWRGRIGRFFQIAGLVVFVLLLLYAGFIVAFHG